MNNTRTFSASALLTCLFAALVLAASCVSASGSELIAAVEEGDADRVKMLLENGAKPDIQSNAGETALMWSAYNGYTECVQLLLQAGANPDVQDNNGQTALMLSAYLGNTECARLLLDAGANPNLRAQNGAMALSLATGQGYTAIANMLRNAGGGKGANSANILLSLGGKEMICFKESKEKAKWHINRKCSCWTWCRVLIALALLAIAVPVVDAQDGWIYMGSVNGGDYYFNWRSVEDRGSYITGWVRHIVINDFGAFDTHIM